MKNYIYDQFKALTAIPSPTGFTRKVAEHTKAVFESLGFPVTMTHKGSLIIDFGGEGDALVYSAHIDTLGGMVAEIKSNGALRMTKIGGLNANNVEAENATVYTRSGKTYSGVCQLENASIHVNTKYSETKRDFDSVELLLDELTFSKKETEALGVATGDYICFDPRTVMTDSGFIKSRFLDDKLSVALLMAYARDIKEKGAKLSRHVYGMVTVFEEIGHGAAASVPEDAVDFISVDMGCVGTGLGCREDQCSICVKDSSGPSSYELTSELIRCAAAHNVDYALDVYPSYGSDADVALRAGYELRHCVIGSGVYASHGYERTHINGALATLKLMEGYTFLE